MYRFIRGLAIALSRLSPAASERLGRMLAVLAFDVFRMRRRLILRNLALAFGDERSPRERVRLGRAAMTHCLWTFLEFLRAVREDILTDITLSGKEHLHAALAQGRGGYILCGHLGNWEAMGGMGSRLFAPTHAIVKDMSHPSVDRFVKELRIASGVQSISRHPPGAALRAVRRVLKQNELVGFMLDQARPGAPHIPFFGAPAKTQTSLAAIWRKVPAPVIPVSIRRMGFGRHHITIHPPLDLTKTENARQDILDLTARFNEALEKMIREAPEQYFWLHNRWKP